MNEKQNWIGERKRWVFDDKQNRVSTLKLCKINEKQNRIVEKKDGYPTNLERKVEQDFSEKKMGVEGKVDQDLRKKKQKKNKKKKFLPPQFIADAIHNQQSGFRFNRNSPQSFKSTTTAANPSTTAPTAATPATPAATGTVAAALEDVDPAAQLLGAEGGESVNVPMEYFLELQARAGEDLCEEDFVSALSQLNFQQPTALIREMLLA